MKIHFLGTGSAFTSKNNNGSFSNFQSNFLIESGNRFLLFDAGTDIRFSLASIGKSYKDLDSVYISHLHADHSGGLEYLAFCSFFDPIFKQRNKIQLVGQSDVLSYGWAKTWSGGLESIQGRVLRLEDYFDVLPIPSNGIFLWQDIEFSVVQSVHVMNGYTIVPSFGLMARQKPNGKTVYFPSDTQFNPNQIMDFYKQADVIIQDCETMPYKSGVHAHISELSTLPPEIKKKMYLIHYNDNVMNFDGTPTEEFKENCNKEGFGGVTVRQEVLEF